MSQSPQRQSPQRRDNRDTKETPQQITLSKPRFLKIDELQPQFSGFSVYVKIGDISSKINRQYLDNTYLRIWEAVVADDSGCMILTVRGKLFFFHPKNTVWKFT